jgi:hypothetical protein
MQLEENIKEINDALMKNWKSQEQEIKDYMNDQL